MKHPIAMAGSYDPELEIIPFMVQGLTCRSPWHAFYTVVKRNIDLNQNKHSHK